MPSFFLLVKLGGMIAKSAIYFYHLEEKNNDRLFYIGQILILVHPWYVFHMQMIYSRSKNTDKELH